MWCKHFRRGRSVNTNESSNRDGWCDCAWEGVNMCRIWGGDGLRWDKRRRLSTMFGFDIMVFQSGDFVCNEAVICWFARVEAVLDDLVVNSTKEYRSIQSSVLPCLPGFHTAKIKDRQIACTNSNTWRSKSSRRDLLNSWHRTCFTHLPPPPEKLWLKWRWGWGYYVHRQVNDRDILTRLR